MNKQTNYEDQKKREAEWWEGKKKKKSLMGRFLSSKLFYGAARSYYSYSLSKKKFNYVIKKHLKNNKLEKVLIAPCGAGGDFEYVNEFSDEIYGIDLSPVGIKSCPASMITKKGDISNSGYPDETFDLIASTLFFHHLVKIGFHPFLKEFYRILKPGGKIAILDFSVLYPLNALTRPLKTIFRNPLGEIEEEAPFRPKYMINSLKQVGFKNLEMYGGTFSHPFFYVPLSKIINFFTKPLLDKSPFKSFAWTIIYWGKKPK